MATNAQNQQNSPTRAGSSRFKGVSWDVRKRSGGAFWCDGQHHFVGNFADETEAARTYYAAVLQVVGAFARFNFP